MSAEHVSSLINALKADSLLHGSWLLEDIKRLTTSLHYKTGGESVSYEDFYQLLLSEVEGIPSIKLRDVVTPGTSRAYLIDLTSALETTSDRIEGLTNKILFFRAKVSGAKNNISSLGSTFKAWYLIVLQQELKRLDLKLGNAPLGHLADSEFDRLMGDTSSDIEALAMALDLLVDRLKGKKRLAQEKYNLGKDQANMSLIPELSGRQAGYTDGNNGSDLLQSRYGLTPLSEEAPQFETRKNLVLDDPPVKAAPLYQEVEAVDAEEEPTPVKVSGTTAFNLAEGADDDEPLTYLRKRPDPIVEEEVVKPASTCLMTSTVRTPKEDVVVGSLIAGDKVMTDKGIANLAAPTITEIAVGNADSSVQGALRAFGMLDDVANPKDSDAIRALKRQPTSDSNLVEQEIEPPLVVTEMDEPPVRKKRRVVEEEEAEVSISIPELDEPPVVKRSKPEIDKLIKESLPDDLLPEIAPERKVTPKPVVRAEADVESVIQEGRPKRQRVRVTFDDESPF